MGLRARQWPWIGLCAVVILAGSWKTWTYQPADQHLVLDAAAVHVETEATNCYLFSPGRVFDRGDGSWGALSRVRLHEDGIPLPFPHALHDDVRRLGRGRYSHWHGTLFFSTSDNTDPRANGRHYELVGPPRTPRAIRAWKAAVACAAFGLVVLFWRLSLRVYLLAVPLAGLALPFVVAAAALRGWSCASPYLLDPLWTWAHDPRAVAQWPAWAPGLLFLWACGGHALTFFARRWPRSAGAREIARGVVRAARCLRWGGCAAAVALALLATSGKQTALSANPRNYDHHAYFALLGTVPWSDAQLYYRSAEQLARGAEPDERMTRPMIGCIGSVFLALSGHRPPTAILLQGALLGAAVYFAAWSVGRRYGMWSGVAAFAGIWGFGDLFVATWMTEPLGLCLGCLGFGLCVTSLDRPRSTIAGFAILALCLANSVRVGALLLLPAVTLWLVWRCARAEGTWKPVVLATLAALGLGLGCSSLINALYRQCESVPSGNSAHILCGLAYGTNWLEREQAYAEELHALPSYKAQCEFMMQKALTQIREHPQVLLAALCREGAALWVDYVPFTRKILTCPEAPGADWLARIGGAVFLATLALSLVTLWRTRATGDWKFWLLTLTAIFVSMPLCLVWRILAGSWPFLAALPALGLAQPRRLLLSTADAQWNPRIIAAMIGVVSIAVAALLGPLLVRQFSDVPGNASELVAAEEGDWIVARGWPHVAAVVVVDGEAPPVAGVPTIELSDFIARMVATREADHECLLVPAPPRPPFVVASLPCLARGRLYTVIAPVEIVAKPARRWLLRCEPYKGSRQWAQVVEWRPLD